MRQQQHRPGACGLPEGLIDPDLRSVALLDGDEQIVVVHDYATHPMSHYGDGRVTSDFVGLARKRRQDARSRGACTST